MSARRWSISYRYDPPARVIADRHYNRQTIGAPQFAPPGRLLVLTTPQALWVTTWPEFAQHEWVGAWMNTAFRNENREVHQSSDLILEAVACTRWKWPDVPELGMVTFVDPSKVRRKRDPGRCYLRAGFKRCGTTKGGLPAFQLLPEDMPEPLAPLGVTESLFA